jgi:hypothetical protein
VVKLKYIILAGLAVAIGIVVVVILLPSEEKRVKKPFRLLSDFASKDKEENLLATARKARNIGALFSEKVEFKTNLAPFSGTLTPDEISGYAARGRSLFSTFDLKFYDIEIQFPEERTAVVTLTARAKGKLLSGELLNETHEVECQLTKSGSKWLINRFEMVEVLKR